MNYSAKIFLRVLILTPFLFSCDNLLDSTGSKETSDDIYRIDLFSFYSWENSSILNASSFGLINDSEKTITIPFPPDIDPDNQNLTATILAVNEEDSQDSYWATINRTWAENSTLELTRNLIDDNWDGTSLYETEYTLLYERRLIPYWNTTPDGMVGYSPYNVFYSDSIEIILSFNGDINRTTLSTNDFTGSYYSYYDNYYVSTDDDATSLENLTPLSLSFPDDSQREIILSLGELYEGYYEISLPADSCESTSSVYLNEASSVFKFLYDAYDPAFVDSPSLDFSDSCLTPDENFYLNAYLPAADDTMAGPDNLYYKIVYSTSGFDSDGEITDLMGSDDFLPIDCSQWNTYTTSYSWSYSELPDDFLASLNEGQSYYLNVLVMDLSGRCIKGNETEITCESASNQ